MVKFLLLPSICNFSQLFENVGGFKKLHLKGEGVFFRTNHVCFLSTEYSQKYEYFPSQTRLSKCITKLPLYNLITVTTENKQLPIRQVWTTELLKIFFKKILRDFKLVLRA